MRMGPGGWVLKALEVDVSPSGANPGRRIAPPAPPSPPARRATRMDPAFAGRRETPREEAGAPWRGHFPQGRGKCHTPAQSRQIASSQPAAGNRTGFAVRWTLVLSPVCQLIQPASTEA